MYFKYVNIDYNILPAMLLSQPLRKVPFHQNQTIHLPCVSTKIRFVITEAKKRVMEY